MCPERMHIYMSQRCARSSSYATYSIGIAYSPFECRQPLRRPRNEVSPSWCPHLICGALDLRCAVLGLGRFILADTDQLHRKISEMSERIRQLEDALAIFQAGISHERHPLLRDELLTIKFGPEVRRTVDEEHSRDLLSSSIDALGTLTVGEHGESKYFGRSAGSEVRRTCSGGVFLIDDPPPTHVY